MDAFEILISSILLIGVIAMVVVAIVYWKEFLNVMKNGWVYPGFGTIIFLPIWGPFWIADKIFHLGIFEERAGIREDLEYESEGEIKINFTDYVHYLIAGNTTLSKINNSIKAYKEIIPDERTFNGFKYREADTDIIVELPSSILFSNFIEIIQHIQDDLKGTHQIIGLAINKVDSFSSYFLIDDPTGMHINSLIGRMKNGQEIFVYLLSDYKN